MRVLVDGEWRMYSLPDGDLFNLALLAGLGEPWRGTLMREDGSIVDPESDEHHAVVRAMGNHMRDLELSGRGNRAQRRASRQRRAGE